MADLNLNKSTSLIQKNSIWNYVTSETSLSQESMSQALNEVREVVDSMPLTQDSEQTTDHSAEDIAIEEVAVNYPEVLKSVLSTMLVVPNKEFVDLYFQCKLCLLHENEWWVNAKHNEKTQIDRKHSLVLCRMNRLEMVLIQKRSVYF